MVPIIAPGIIPLIALVAMLLAVLRIALGVSLPLAITGSAHAVAGPQTNATHVIAAINERCLIISVLSEREDSL